jgi:lipoyl(octanoyl) transferase
VSPESGLLIRSLPGLQDYQRSWDAMRAFTEGRRPDTEDELWLLEHPPVFTLGQAARPEHLLNPGPIPVVRCDRGGQVTYHGPGQLVAYLLLDLRRRGFGVRRLVSLLQDSVIDLLARRGIEAVTRVGAPGVYVGGAKIASLGLRVRGGCTYHGLALNVAMDLLPFTRINPCGCPGLAITQLSDWIPNVTLESARVWLAEALPRVLEMRPCPQE